MENKFDQPPQSEVDLSGLSVLVAEDGEFTRVLYRRIFERLGVAAHFAKDAFEAEMIFDKLQQEGVAPNVLQTDYNMPGKKGIELLQGLRKKAPDLVGILVTSERREDLGETGENFEYLDKRDVSLDAIKGVLGVAASKIQSNQQQNK